MAMVACGTEARRHWTAQELHAALQPWVKKGRVQAGPAAAALHNAHPERLRPRANAAATAMRLLDAQAFGLLYLTDEGGPDRDAHDLPVLWPKAGIPAVKDLKSDTEESEASTESETGESSVLTPSSTPAGVEVASQLAARHAAQKVLQQRRLMRLRPEAATAGAARAGEQEPNAAAGEQQLVAKEPKVTVRGKAKATAKANAAKVLKPQKARGAAAARDARTEAHTSFRSFQTEQLRKLKGEGCSGKAAMQAVGKLWLEHQAKVLGKPYGCPKCRWQTGCRKCQRWAPRHG